MVNGSSSVIIISNDIVPGFSMPVAAPGLRAFGLAEGLRAHGLRVKTLIGKELLNRQWGWRGPSIPPPTPVDVDVIEPQLFSQYLERHAPATVILINSNQINYLERIDGIRYILDFFAPKMLELAYQGGEVYPIEDIKRLRQQKLRAIDLADGFIINGKKKVPYFLAWLLQSDRDIRQLPFAVVPMGVPQNWVDTSIKDKGAVRLAITGYLHRWDAPGEWVGTLERLLSKNLNFHLDLLLPFHWGNDPYRQGFTNEFERLASYPAVTSHSPMPFSNFQRFLSTVDVVIDLFAHNLEREYAMVTRSVVALACGVPVMHPPFTEVSPFIAQYDAGWLLDADNTCQIQETLEAIINDPQLVQQKAKNARKLAQEVFDPAIAARPLLRLIEHPTP